MLAEGLMIRRAEPADAAALAAFGARTFTDAFGAGNTPDDLAAYLARAYGERQQLTQLADPHIVTLLVESRVPRADPRAADAFVAFSQVRRATAPPCVTFPSPVELWRFYVAREWHGQGVAPALMEATLEAGRELGGASIWLSVWQKNPRAIAFYAKSGFAVVGSAVFVVGSDHQSDHVMAREIAFSPAV